MVSKGIDISSHQGADIDFEKVKAAGYSFVIIKAGESRTEMATFKTKPDYRYMQRVKAAGMDWSAYWWSNAVTVAEAKQEAEAFIKALAGTKPTFPVYMDQEYDSPPDKLGISATARQLRTDMVKAFLDTLLEAGYFAGLYTSTDWINTRLYDAQLTHYPKWIAQYKAECTYKGKYGMWQHHGNSPGFVGRVDGISVPVDLNECYENYPAIIKANLFNGWTHTDLGEGPEPEVPEAEKSVTLAQAGEILRAAGVEAIRL